MKRFEIWKINSKKNGVKDNQENAYYSLEEFLDWLNEKDKHRMEGIMNEKQYQIDSLIVDKEILTDNLDNARLIIKSKDRTIKQQQATIQLFTDFIKKEFPKSYKHIMEGL